MRKNLYFSCPLSIPTSERDDIIKCISSTKLVDGSISFYKRGTEYSSKDVDNADILVIMHLDNAFKFDVNMLTPGCRKEVLRSIQRCIPIILCYRTVGGDDCLYNTKITLTERGYRLEGMSGFIFDKSQINTIYDMGKWGVKEETSAYFESRRRGEMWHNPVKPEKETFNSLPLLIL